MNHKTVLCIFLLPIMSISVFGQTTNLQKTKDLLSHKEISSAVYKPNAYNNLKLTPAYSFNNSTANQKAANSSIFTTQVNISSSGMNIIGDAANEPSIAFNPNTGQEIVIGWRQFDNIGSSFRQAGWAYTADAGTTWTFPGVIEPGVFRSDPVLDYDGNGDFYYNSLRVVSGVFDCQVFKSTDGGMTWNSGVHAFGGDKQWMAIDRTGGVGENNIYSFWTSNFSSCGYDNFTRSDDSGLSFDSCTFVTSNPFWGTMLVGNTGEMYIGARQQANFLEFVCVSSSNAQSPGSSIAWNAPVTVSLDGVNDPNPAVNPSGLLGQADIGIEPGSSPDVVYLCASVVRNGTYDPGDVMFARSIDGGLTWSSPVKINDDVSTTNTQWFGTMSVSPTGRIDVIWLDTRDAPAGSDSSALYYSYSNDQGMTWSPNEMLSAKFDPHVGYPQQNKLGDYFDMESDSIGAHLAWAATFNGEQDVYYSYIVPPTFTGITELNNNIELIISPNPVNHILSINGFNNETLFIYNSVGQLVFEEEVENSELITIDVSNWHEGVYIIRSKHAQNKFIKLN